MSVVVVVVIVIFVFVVVLSFQVFSSLSLFPYCCCVGPRRREAMQAGLKKAIEVPLEVMKTSSGCWPHLTTIAQHGNITALSDVQVL